jgi:hypothetical protein
MNQYGFGPGSLVAIPKFDASGNAITNPTPVKFGAVQDVAFDGSWEIKKLYGRGQFPLAVGRGKGSMTGKLSFAQVNGRLYNSLLFGQTLTAGVDAVYEDFTGTVIPDTPYAITPTVPNAGTWAADLGVINLLTGSPMTKIDSAGTPTTGQYKVAAGVYTFAAADKGQTVLINFEYTGTSTSAAIIDIFNMPMGYCPSFQVVFTNSFAGGSEMIMLTNCVATKFAFPTKLDDFTLRSIDFEACVDPTTNKLGRIATTAM